MNRRILSGLFLVAAGLLVSGCTTTPSSGDGAPVSEQGTAAEGAITAGARAGGALTMGALDDPSSPVYEKVVYFEFDQSDIAPKYMDMLRAHAGLLLNNRDAVITVEGHCDERGSREYNIGLGERRASAVQRFLEAEGVLPSQISTLSYGEERPADSGYGEAAWAQNRRAVLVY